MIVINAQVPFFSAGQKYQWKGSPIGIGVPATQLKNKNETLRVNLKSDGKIYEIPVLKARELVLQYNSFFMSKRTKLAIIPMQEFAIVGEHSSKIANKEGLDALQHEVLELVKFCAPFKHLGAKEIFIDQYNEIFKKYKENS